MAGVTAWLPSSAEEMGFVRFVSLVVVLTCFVSVACSDAEVVDSPEVLAPAASQATTSPVTETTAVAGGVSSPM